VTERRRPLSRVYAWVVVQFGIVFVLGWIAVAVWATRSLPSVNPEVSGRLSDLLPRDAPALEAEIRSDRLFRFPLLSREVVVQRDPTGIPLDEQGRTVEAAVAVDTGKLKARYPSILGAVPLSDTIGLGSPSSERGTTMLTYLYTAPNLGLADRVALGERFAREQLPGHLVGETGLAPAQLEQGRLIEHALPFVEVVTVAFIALLVGLTFRSIGAPLLTLATAAIAYAVAIHVIGWGAPRFGFELPGELHPLVVVLLLGLATDYSVFFLSGMRARLAAGLRPLQAAQDTALEFGHIILTAGLIVAAGTASLLAASIGLFRSLGPSLAVTVLIGLAVAITFVPATIGLFGRALFWPRAPARVGGLSPSDPRRAEPSAVGSEGAEAGTMRPGQPPLGLRSRAMRVATFRPVAIVLVLASVAGLGFAAFRVGDVGLGVPLIRGLPADSEAARAERAASAGFAPGILSPVELVLDGPGVAGKLSQLDRLDAAIDARPSVVSVFGPGSVPSSIAGLVPDVAKSAFLAEGGDAARMLLILRDDPLGPAGLDAVRALQGDMPSMLRRAGLTGVRVSWAGDAVLAAETIDETLSDLVRVGIAAALVALVLLIVFLRALVAPVLLLVASLLSVLSAMGSTVLFFQGLLHAPGITYYVPFAAGVLLISLGADYNVFIVARIWSEAERRPIREAIVVAAPLASRAITLAGLALAGSFAFLALIPVLAFRQLAFMLAVGVLIDSFLVRSVLVPSLLATLRGASEWPWRRLRRARPPDEHAPAAPAGSSPPNG
jgi:RND superfamily putative drug exporter